LIDHVLTSLQTSLLQGERLWNVYCYKWGTQTDSRLLWEVGDLA